MQPAIAIETFLNRFPRFNSREASEVQAVLRLAERQCAPSSWGNRWEDGVCYLAAHLLELDWLQTAQTSATAANIAAASKQPALPDFGPDSYRRTLWGSTYLQLKRSLPITHIPLVY